MERQSNGAREREKESGRGVKNVSLDFFFTTMSRILHLFNSRTKQLYYAQIDYNLCHVIFDSCLSVRKLLVELFPDTQNFPATVPDCPSRVARCCNGRHKEHTILAHCPLSSIFFYVYYAFLQIFRKLYTRVLLCKEDRKFFSTVNSYINKSVLENKDNMKIL